MRAHRLRLSFALATAFTAASLASTIAHAQQNATGTRAPSTSQPPPASAATTTPATPPKASPALVEPPKEPGDESTNVYEKPGKAYYFVGLRYRGNVIPKFMLNIFVRGGKTIYSSSVGAELDIRKDGFSFIPSLTYTEFGTGGDMLMLEKGKPDTANNWSAVDSSLKGLFVNADLLWSAKLHRNVDFEYGVGVGVGTIFGSLVNNWVYDDPNGALKDPDSDKRFSKCTSENQPGDPQGACKRGAHSNSADAKVDGYEEKSWFNGGSKPNFFIHLAPTIGLRFKPVKEMTARLGIGFSLTGFFFGVSGNYGLERLLDKKSDRP